MFFLLSFLFCLFVVLLFFLPALFLCVLKILCRGCACSTCFVQRFSFVIKVLLYVHRNRRFIRDGEPKTSTSTFTQLLTSAFLSFLPSLGFLENIVSWLCLLHMFLFCIFVLFFCFCFPFILNQLPVSVRHCTSVSSFKSSLKTCLFKKNFPSVSLP